MIFMLQKKKVTFMLQGLILMTMVKFMLVFDNNDLFSIALNSSISLVVLLVIEKYIAMVIQSFSFTSRVEKHEYVRSCKSATNIFLFGSLFRKSKILLLS